MVGTTTMGNGNELKATIVPITPELITLWDAELKRLHADLSNEKLTPEEKTWVRDQITNLHRVVFGNSPPNN